TTFTDILSATSNTYSTSQSVTTYYQCIVTCSNGGLSDTSVSVQVVNNSLSNCYCSPSYGNACTSNDVITNVTFGTINNSTGCTGSFPSNLTYYPLPNPVLYKNIS